MLNTKSNIYINNIDISSLSNLGEDNRNFGYSWIGCRKKIHKAMSILHHPFHNGLYPPICKMEYFLYEVSLQKYSSVFSKKIGIGL